MPGKGKLTITGQLGDVMKESAQAALSYVRGHADLARRLVRDPRPARPRARGRDPEGRPERRDHDGDGADVARHAGARCATTLAMTGEITLTGQVLPIGGLKEKALAAQRAGIKRVIAPRRNEPDLEDIPEQLRENLDFVWVDEIGDVFDAALENGRPGYARRRPGMLAEDAIEIDERGHGEQEGAEGRAGGSVGPLQPVRPADRRGRGAAPEHRPGVRVGARRLRPASQRQEPDEADLRRQEAAEAHQSSRGSVRDASVALYEAPKKQSAGGGFGSCCCSASSAARSRSPSPRACARRCSTRCSAPRRSSSTPRPPRRRRRRRRPRRARRPARPTDRGAREVPRRAPYGALRRSHSPAMKSRTSTSAPGRASVSLP